MVQIEHIIYALVELWFSPMKVFDFSHDSPWKEWRKLVLEVTPWLPHQVFIKRLGRV